MAKRLIDAKALSDKVEESKHNNPHSPGMIRANHIFEHNHFLRMILDAPTVDAVEVVRCRDCVNYCGFEHCKNGICDVDSVSKRSVYPDDFCSYGERMEK